MVEGFADRVGGAGGGGGGLGFGVCRSSPFGV